MTEKCSTLSIPTSLGAASNTTKLVAANLSNRAERNPRPPKKGNQKLRSDRAPNGANDPVALEDIGFAPSPSSTRVLSLSPRNQKERVSPIKHTKQK